MRAILIALVVIGLGALIYFRPHFAMCASNGEIAEPEKESIDAAALAFVERLYAEQPEAALAAMSRGGDTDEVRNTLAALARSVRETPGENRAVHERHRLLHLGLDSGGTPCVSDDGVAVLANGGGLRTAFAVVTEALPGAAERSWTLWLVREGSEWRVRKFNVGLSAVAGRRALDMLTEAQRQERLGYDFNATLLYDMAGRAAYRGSFFESAEGDRVFAARAAHRRHPELPEEPPYAFVLGGRSFPLEVIKPIGDERRRLVLILTQPAGGWRGVEDAERRNRELIAAMNRYRGEWRQVFDALVVQAPMDEPDRSWGTVYRREGGYVRPPPS
jgi:hypothetical protein